MSKEPVLYSASAPGSLMLFGEYAVLYGWPAIVAAINKRIKVTVTPLSSNHIKIDSQLGQYQTTISRLSMNTPFDYILAALMLLSNQLTTGCHIKVCAEFSSHHGLGSSAAVTVATLAALQHWLKMTITPIQLLEQAKQVITAVQGKGSGSDAAASIFGGVISYRSKMNEVEPLNVTPTISVVYSGSKTKTATAISHISTMHHSDANFPTLIKKIGTVSEQAIPALLTSNKTKLSELCQTHQTMMQKIGASNPQLESIVDTLNQQEQLSGAKISGSGLGDCVVAFGQLDPNQFSKKIKQINGVKPLMISLSRDGVNYGYQ